MMNKVFFPGSTSALAIILLAAPAAFGAQQLNVLEADQPPAIDGSGSDDAWSKAEAIDVKDSRTGERVTLQAVRSGDMIYFLVSFADAAEDRLHKPWVWDEGMKAYKLGPQREDGFTLKWNMAESEVDLSNFSDDDYTADVWYWKAHRTDPAGYADDKHHIFSSEAGKKSKELKSRSGKSRYLMRVGDEGTSAQKKRLLTDYQGDVQAQYEPRKPDGSRADVLAKGAWKDGGWTVEFGRKFDTGQVDDVQFDPASGNKYLFGISIFGLYGDGIDDSKDHLYGQGRISENIHLVFP